MNHSDTPKTQKNTTIVSSSYKQQRPNRTTSEKKPTTSEGITMTQAHKNPTQKQPYKAPQEQASASPELSASPAAIAQEEPAKVVAIKHEELASAQASTMIALSEKVVERSQEGMQKFAQMADRMQRAMSESVEIGRTQMEACSQARNVTTECVSKIYEEFIESAQKAMAEHVDISKELFTCRTAQDIFSVQSRLMQMNAERMITNMSRMSNRWCAMTAKASEPISDSINDAAQRISKAFSN